MRPYRGMTKEGKLVYGWYCEVETVCYIILDDAQLDWEGNIHRGSFFEVIPSSVGQSTGKQDKNKKEVFAGDKVRGRSYIQTDGRYINFEGIVEWSDQYAGFYIRGEDKDGNKRYLYFEIIIMADLEVIGKTENPELLEKE